jgi:hypothetical protein
MKINKIKQYPAYQTSFQRRHIGGKVPKPIADAIRHAQNLTAIEEKYALRFEKDPDEDLPGINRIILFLFILINI